MFIDRCNTVWLEYNALSWLILSMPIPIIIKSKFVILTTGECYLTKAHSIPQQMRLMPKATEQIPRLPSND